MAKRRIDINKKLIEQSLEGDRKAQHKLYTLYADAMLNVAYRITNNKEDAEDVLQEAFIDAFTKLHTFRFESTFGSWLKRIVVNKTINRFRQQKLDLAYLGDHDLSQIPDLQESEAYAGLSVDKVKGAMQNLPEGARVVFDLILFEGYKHKQIAEVLNISVSTSKTQYRYAKLKMKEYLKLNEA